MCFCPFFQLINSLLAEAGYLHYCFESFLRCIAMKNRTFLFIPNKILKYRLVVAGHDDVVVAYGVGEEMMPL